jgi:oxygen-independent coproporphyrinogen-3 oxidase
MINHPGFLFYFLLILRPCRFFWYIIQNITVHMFSRKRASRFTSERDRFVLPAESTAAALYKAATELLGEKYIPYYLYRQREILGGQENIGYCLPGTECVYNIAMIEERHNILGLGCGATSKRIKEDLTLQNYTTPKDVHMYIDRIAQIITARAKQLNE